MKTTIKRALTSIMMLVFVCQLLYVGNGKAAMAAVDTNLYINFNLSKSTVYKGDTFVLTLSIKNTSGLTIEDISANIDSSNTAFFPVNGNSEIKFLTPLANGSSDSKPVTLMYNGGLDKKLVFNIRYTLNDTPPKQIEITKTIGVNAIDPSELPVSTPVDTKKYAPKLSVQTTSVPTINAGDLVTVTLPIKNTNVNGAVDITVTPTIEKDDNLIFLEDTNASKNIAKLDANATENVTFRFRTSQNAVTKSYPIKISMDYNNLFGDSFSSSSIVYVKVVAQPPQTATSGIEITTVTSAPDTITAGDKTTMTIGVKNTGSAVLKSVKVSLSGIKDDVLSLGSGASKKTISEIAPGGTANVTFALTSSKKAPEGSYSVLVKADAKDSNDKALSDDQTYYIGISNKDSSALDLTNVVAYPKTIMAGENAYVEATIKNNGNYKLDNIKCSLSGFKEEALSISDSSNKKIIKSLAPDEETKVVFTLTSSKKAAEGNYAVNAKIECKDKNDKVLGDDQSIYVTINQKEIADSSLEIRDVTVPNTALVSNKEFSLGFSVVNTGGDSIKNVKVTLTPDPLLIAKTPNAKVITTLAKDGKLPMKFLFMIPRDAADKNYPIQIAAEYETLVNGVKTKQTVNQYTNVYVDNFGVTGNKKSVPKLIVNKYSIEPEMPKAGSNIKLHISFLNTSSTKKVRNIKIFLAADGSQTETGNVFVPVNGSNTFYIDEIKQKQTINQGLELYVVNDAKPKTYNLTVNFEYEDELGTEYKAVETIGIPVRPQAKLDTSAISIPTEITMIDPLIVSFDMYNTGKSMLRNLMIKSVGNFDVQNQNSFIGNLDVGSQEHYEATLVPKGPGSLKGEVLISFEDAAGQIQQIKKEILTKVINPPPVTNPDGSMPGQPPVVQEKKTDIKVYAGAGAGVFVVVVVAIVFIKKRKRKKLEEMMLGE